MKKTTRTRIAALGLAAVTALAAGPAGAARVRATVRTSGMFVHFDTAPGRVVRVVSNRRYRRLHRLTRRDRRIARRLARFSGVRPRRILRMRRAGLGWYRIGRRIGLPRFVVRAALHGRSWRRFVRRWGDEACLDSYGRIDLRVYGDFDDDWDARRPRFKERRRGGDEWWRDRDDERKGRRGHHEDDDEYDDD